MKTFFDNRAFCIPFLMVIFIICSVPLSARHGDNPPPPPPPGPHMYPDDPENMPMGPGMHFDDPGFMKNELGLSDEQINAVGRINQDFHNRMLQLRKKIAPERDHLRDLLRAEPVDTAEVKKILQNIGSLQTEIRYQMILHRLDIEKVLTAEQRKKLREEMRPPRRGRGFPND